MKIKKIFIVTIFLFEVYVLQLWLICQKFADGFHFSEFDTKLKIEQGVHSDAGLSASLARFFHNKIDVSFTEIFGKYIKFWDFRFDSLFFSIVGTFGIVYGFWYIACKKKRTRKHWIIISVLLLLPFFEVFKIPMPFLPRLMLLSIPYLCFSLYGLWQFMMVHKVWGKMIVLILLLLSIWFIIVFQKDILGNFCYN